LIRWIGIAAALVVLVLPHAAEAWGGRTHEIINRRAAERLTGEAGAAWSPLARSLGSHASDADHRKSSVAGERPRHFLDIDAWDDYPFDDVPRDFDDLVKRHGRQKAEQFGVVPWAIDECYRMVVKALERGDWAAAGAWAADLGHYVADSHQPLHCTINYDGQNTGNHGVHLRFEVTMMDRFYDETVLAVPELPDVPAEGPVEFCFSWIREAYPGLAVILAADDEARTLDPGYGDAYYEALWSRTQDAASDQVEAAVRDLSALYAAAWEEAGRPAPPEGNVAFRLAPIAELDPPAPRSSRTPRGAFLAAGAAILAAFVVGAS
jgi:hypothetical protein